MAGDHPRLVILAVDRLTLQDLQVNAGPHLHRLMREGAVGLMTTRSLGGLAPEKIYLSIGAGEGLTTGLDSGRLIFDAAETYQGLRAREAYRLQHGGNPGNSGLFHLGLAGLTKANALLPGRFGRLGEALQRQGWRLAVLGNADTNAGPCREAAALLMDREGRVPLGHVGADTLLEDWRAPGGLRTDYAKLRADYGRLCGRAEVVLVALGDLARLQAAGPSLTPAMADRHLRTAMSRIDRFVGQVLQADRRPDRIILLVASPPLSSVASGERLTPFIVWGKDIRPGLAMSGSTRQAGVITPYDITATIAGQSGVNPSLVTLGRPIVSTPGAPDALPRYYAWLVRNYQERAPFFQIYGYAMLLAATIALALAARGRKEGPAAWARALLVGLAMVPALLLVQGLMPLGPTWLTLFEIGLGAILVGFVLSRFRWRDSACLALAGLSTTGLVLLDVLLGSPLLRRSLLGYSPVFGARFYGLGNEYLGVVLGAVVLGGAALLDLRRRGIRSALAVLFLATTLIIALPRFGANVGGGISAFVGLGYTYLLLIGHRVGWRETGGLIFGVLGLVGLLILCDLWGARGHLTHLGQTALRAHREGLGMLMVIVAGKLAMNWRILSYTSWTWVMLGVLLLAPVAFVHPPRWLAGLFPAGHPLAAAIRGLLVTAGVGLLVNDSGVVVAATILIYIGVALVYLVRSERAEAREVAIS